MILYGELATRPEHGSARGCARGAGGGWRSGSRAGEVRPDFGPPRAHPTAGVVLAAARPPLVAFNIDLRGRRPGNRRADRGRGPRVRRAGCPGVRAIGLLLESAGAPRCRPTSTTTGSRRSGWSSRRCAARADIAEAELVGLAPAAAFQRLPGRRADPRLLARAAPAGERVTLNLLGDQWPRRRRSAAQAPRHPAGTIERAGRTGSSRTPAGRQADRARAAGRAPEPRAHLAGRREPRRHRRRGVRRAGGRGVRPRARPAARSSRCSCSCSTSRSAT